jgi:hypothetical protein
VRGRPFKTERSGNPARCRPGSRNRAAIAAAKLLAGGSEGLTRRAVELALAGDSMAAVVDTFVRAIETGEFERRLQELEDSFKAQDAARVAGAGSSGLTTDECDSAADLLQISGRRRT